MNNELEMFLVGMVLGACLLYAAMRLWRTLSRRGKDPCEGCCGCKQ